MFITLLQEAFEHYQGSWLVNGFKACGLSPFDPDAVDYSKCCTLPEIDEAESGPPISEDSSMPFIIELEERMTLEQLILFKEQKGEWDGPPEMRMLYDLWKKADEEALALYSTGAATDDSSEDEDSILSLPEPHQPRRS